MAYSTRKCASRRRKASRRKTYRRNARRGGKTATTPRVVYVAGIGY